jgi:hypothetical protein
LFRKTRGPRSRRERAKSLAESLHHRREPAE